MKRQELLRWGIPFVLLLAAYFATRLVSIRTLPPFNDEFIYVRWAQEGFFDPAKRLLSLTDGKQPLYVWLTSFMMNLVPSPLAAGRIVSILSGAAAMVGLAVLSYRIFKNRAIALFASFVYVLFPLAILMDRFALYDSLLMAIAVWNLIVMHMLIASPNLGTALVLALLLGAALLTKSSALLLLPMFTVMILFLSKNTKTMRKTAGYVTLSALIAWLYQSVQHLSPEFGSVAQKNTTFIYTWDQLKNLPVATILLTNLTTYLDWIVSYFTWPILLAAGSVSLFRLGNRRTLRFLLLSFFLPLIAVSLVGKTIYSRHIFFLLVPVFMLIGWGLAELRQKLNKTWTSYGLIALLFIPMGMTGFRMLADFKSAPMPAIDKFQYIEGWPAGWGIKEIVQLLEPEAAKGELTVITEGEFGSMTTTAMKLYFGNYPQVHIRPVDDKTFLLPDDMDWAHPVYAIVNAFQELPTGWQAEEILKIQKGNGNSFIRLYKLAAPKTVDDEGLEPPTSSV